MKNSLPLIIAFSLTGLATTALSQTPDADEDEKERYTRMFNQLDTDGSSTLSKQEAEPAGLSAEDFGHLDKNGDGELDLDEFLVVIPASTQ